MKKHTYVAKHKKTTAFKRLKQKIAVRINVTSNYKEKIWIIGDGRSGTTWLSSLLNSHKYYRELFEPFHPANVYQAKDFDINMYMRPAKENLALYKFVEMVFNGKLSSDWIDKDNSSLFFKGILVKDVFASLFAKWALMQQTDIKILLLIRNPLAVASSKLNTRHWFWQNDPLEFLNNRDLVKDHLQPYKNVIQSFSKKNDFVVNQVLIWSVLHKVMIRQFTIDEVLPVFYENIYTEPNNEIKQIHDLLGLKYQSVLPKDVITRESRVSSKHSSIVNNKSPLNSWREYISEEQLKLSNEILYAFGLHELYPDNDMPNTEHLVNLMSSNTF
ncbi:sulfotransferase domain-containing protein [Alteromonadaceae bacterium BrNp21-10]|nr:sulfotransferase domain-containing protein [Alteromonadaceae bacterium BrNp21-10]